MKKKSVKIPSRQWINTRKKPCTDNILPDGMKSLPQDNTKQNSLEAYFTKEVDEVYYYIDLSLLLIIFNY